MSFTNYLEDENDKPYFTTNSLAYYYDKMEGFAKAVEGSAKALNLTKEEIEQRIALRLAEWDKNLESFDGSVEKLLTEWVDDGTLTHVIDSALIDQRLAPVVIQLEEKVKTEHVLITPGYFGAVGNGIQNDTVAIQQAFNSGKAISFESGMTYLVDHINITKDNVTIDLNGSTFKQSPAATQRKFLNITGKNCSVSNLTMEGNDNLNAVTLDGLCVTGDNTTLKNISIKKFNYSVDVTADYCLIDGLSVENSRYASCRLNASIKKLNLFTLNNFKSLNSRYKGFVYNGTMGIRDIVVTNFECLTNHEVVEDAANGFLIDSEPTNLQYHVERLIATNIYIQAGGSGAFKIENCVKAYLTNIDIDTIATYASSYGINSKCKELYIDGIQADDRISVFGNAEIKKWKVKNNPLKTRSHILEIMGNGTTVYVEGFNASEANFTQQLIRIDRDIDVSHVVKLKEVKGKIDNILIGIFKTPANNTTFIENMGGLSNYSNLTGTGLNNAIVYKAENGFNSYSASQVPTTGTYKKGDRIYNSSPSSGLPQGWVCITAGQPGIWKGFGLIEV